MSFQRLSILGVGLLGGSIGLAVHRASTTCKRTGYGHRGSTLEAAWRLGAIDEMAEDPVQAVRGAELVMLCTPIGAIRQLLEKIGPELAPGTIVTDVGSTKRSVCKMAQEILPKGVSFVGSHPMAGSEKRGIDFARSDLFSGALCITTPTLKTDVAALAKVERFWKQLGMRVTRLNPDEHDRLLADMSHLPHALAAALVAMQSEQSLALAGKGFFDATRIAAGDGALWRDILLDNSSNVRLALSQLRIQLDRLDEMLDPSQGDALKKWLDAAALKRLSRNDGRSGAE